MSHSYQFLIEQSDGGQRLDEFFAARFGGISRMRIANLIEAGACLVNGEIGRAGYRILTGDSIKVSLDDDAPTSMSPERIPLEIVYEDEHLVVVVKPAGMLVHPTLSVKSGTLANALSYHLNKSMIDSGEWELDNLATERDKPTGPHSSVPTNQPVIRPGLVHRLDRATSGLMIVAKTQRAHAVLSRHFRRRLVEKRYLAWVHGIVPQEDGMVNAPIGRAPDQLPRWRVLETGKPAETRFKVIERLREVTLLELEPVTGRTNQIRIHCAHIGHPIVGDQMHANSESPAGDAIGKRDIPQAGSSSDKKERELKASGQVDTVNNEGSENKFQPRLCLHAWKLAFHHPANGEWLEFSIRIPDDIIRTLEQYARKI